MKNKKTPLCMEIKYMEFPGLLFGKQDSGAVYFNATDYIRREGDASLHTVKGFQNNFAFWIKTLGEAYSLTADEMIMQDEETGDVLMEESLSLLFVAYLDPGFAVHILERICEMLLTGIVLSDTALLNIARERQIINK
jgi:hypothetical protein